MRFPAAALLLPGAVAVALLAGCTPAAPVHTDTPTPKATPLFASDEEALAAAKAAYTKYQQVADEVGQGGWADTDPLRSVETGEALKKELQTASSVRAKGLRQTGFSRFENMSFQAQTASTVTVYACVDVSNLDVVDGEGNSALGDERTDNASVQLTFLSRQTSMLLTRSEPWSQDLC